MQSTQQSQSEATRFGILTTLGAMVGLAFGPSVIGSEVIHSRTRASLVCTRPATARVRSRSVTIPISVP